MFSDQVIVIRLNTCPLSKYSYISKCIIQVQTGYRGKEGRREGGREREREGEREGERGRKREKISTA